MKKATIDFRFNDPAPRIHQHHQRILSPRFSKLWRAACGRGHGLTLEVGTLRKAVCTSRNTSSAYRVVVQGTENRSFCSNSSSRFQFDQVKAITSLANWFRAPSRAVKKSTLHLQKRHKTAADVVFP